MPGDEFRGISAQRQDRLSRLHYLDRAAPVLGRSLSEGQRDPEALLASIAASVPGPIDSGVSKLLRLAVGMLSKMPLHNTQADEGQHNASSLGANRATLFTSSVVASIPEAQGSPEVSDLSPSSARFPAEILRGTSVHDAQADEGQHNASSLGAR